MPAPVPDPWFVPTAAAPTGPSGRDPAARKPLLMIDIDGVISLFGFAPERRPEGAFHAIDGIVHFISAEAGRHLLDLTAEFELVWCSGWEEKANEYLPHLLGLPGPYPFLAFARSPGRTRAHWKLEAIDAFAGRRPLAWVDDAFNDACDSWARARRAPTLLVGTDPSEGLTAGAAEALRAWSADLPRAGPGAGQ